MRTKKSAKLILLLLFALFSGNPIISAQSSANITLEHAFELALKNNHLLNVRRYQVEEKRNKINEDIVKFFPTVSAIGTYQYNTNLPAITILQGSFGQLPLGTNVIKLPPTDYRLEMGKHSIYNAGLTFYQPVSQIAKINTGVKISRTEMQLASAEEKKAVFQVKQSVEKIYYGLLILLKQIEEAEIKSSLAKSKLSDAENAVSAGKTLESNRIGLSASAADEEQNLLKLKIQYDDLNDDLKRLTGSDPSTILIPETVSFNDKVETLPAPDSSMIKAETGNNDLRLASLSQIKATESIRASNFGYIPDFGLLGGYTYQEGNNLYPSNNTFIGASLKWNIQDAFSNRTIQRQRVFIEKQAEENLANTRDQIRNDIAKAHRKLKQSAELISVAYRLVEYRREDYRIQGDRRLSGLNLESDLLTAKATLAKAESDYFAARLNFRIALSDLQILTGRY